MLGVGTMEIRVEVTEFLLGKLKVEKESLFLYLDFSFPYFDFLHFRATEASLYHCYPTNNHPL